MASASSLSVAIQSADGGLSVAKRRRARKTNNPISCANTAQGRRVADLMRAYYRALGNPTEVERQAAIVAAAELQVLAEEARTAALKSGGTVDLDQVVRVQGAADRALRRLNLKAAPPKGESLDDYLGSPEHEMAATPQPDTAPAPSDVTTESAEDSGADQREREENTA